MNRAACIVLLLSGCAAQGTPARPPAASSDATTHRPPAPAPSELVRDLVRQLSAEDIQTRDDAEEQLAALGPSARRDLEVCLDGSRDGEARERLIRLLDRLERAELPHRPLEGSLGSVRISFLHSFAWQNAPRGETLYVSTVWALRNLGDRESTVRIARVRLVHGTDIHTVAVTGTKGEPDPTYALGPGHVRKPALKMPSCPAAPAGAEVYAVIDFVDGDGHELSLRTDPASVEKTE